MYEKKRYGRGGIRRCSEGEALARQHDGVHAASRARRMFDMREMIGECFPLLCAGNFERLQACHFSTAACSCQLRPQ